MAHRLKFYSFLPTIVLFLLFFADIYSNLLFPSHFVGAFVAGAFVAKETLQNETLQNETGRQAQVIPCPDLLPPIPFLPYQTQTPSSALSRWKSSTAPVDSNATFHAPLPSASAGAAANATTVRISNGRPADLSLSSYLAFVVTSRDVATCTATLLSPTAVLTIPACAPGRRTVVHVGAVRGTLGEPRAVREWRTLSVNSHQLIVIYLTTPVPSWMRFMSVDANVTAPHLGASFRVAGYGTVAADRSVNESELTYVDTSVQPLNSCQTAFTQLTSDNRTVSSFTNVSHMCVQNPGCVPCAGDLGAPVFLPDVAGAPLLYAFIIAPLWPTGSSSSACSQAVETQPVLLNAIRIAPFIPALNAESRPTTPPTLSPSMTPMASVSMMAARRPNGDPHIAVYAGMGVSIVLAVTCVVFASCLSCRVGTNSRNCSNETRPRHVVLPKDSADAASASVMSAGNASVKWPPEAAARSDGTRSPAGVFAPSRAESLEETRRNLAIADWLRASGSVSAGNVSGAGVTDTDSAGEGKDDRKWSRKNDRRPNNNQRGTDPDAATAPTRRHGQGQTVESRRRLVADWLRSNAVARDARGNPSGSAPLGDA